MLSDAKKRISEDVNGPWDFPMSAAVSKPVKPVPVGATDGPGAGECVGVAVGAGDGLGFAVGLGSLVGLEVGLERELGLMVGTAVGAD
jgi:hypothetical protein